MKKRNKKRTKKYLKQEFNLLKKMLSKYPNYYEYKVLRNEPENISIDFYNLQTRKLEKQAFAEFGKNYIVEFSKEDNFEKGKKIIIKKKRKETVPKIDITGKTYNKLTAIRFATRKKNVIHWLFKCECGNEKVLNKYRVTSGYTRSCGCLMNARRKEFAKEHTTHGLSGRKNRPPEYSIWNGIKQRCLNTKSISYKSYGGRGIKVCDRWKKSFPNFLEDMGKRPTNKHSIDRINNNGNYEPSNCRWATIKEQTRNTRTNRLITIKGETKCLSEWVEFLGLLPKDVYGDLYRKKVDIMKALHIKE